MSKTDANQVVCVSTHSEGYSEFFDQSCVRNGIKPIILGLGAEWKGFTTKFWLLQKYLDTVDDDAVILFVDRFDVIFVRPLDTLFAFYRRITQNLSRPLIYISTEEEEFIKFQTAWAEVKYGTYRGRVINSGSYISTAGLMRKVLDDIAKSSHMKNEYYQDDQAMLTQYLQEHPEVPVMLDNNRRFLVYPNMRLDIGANSHIDKVNKTFTYKNSKPYLIHRNVSGKLTKILDDLGYDVKNISIKNTQLHRIFSSHIPHFLHRSGQKLYSLIAGN